MASLTRFSNIQQREALLKFANEGIKYLYTSEGHEFLRQLELFFAAAVVKRASFWGYQMDSEEAVNLIVERLITTHVTKKASSYSTPLLLAAHANRPFSYLWSCITRWLAREYGVRCDPLESTHEPAVQVLAENHLTDLAVVVDICTRLLANRVPQQYKSELYKLVEFLAYNPPKRRSYESIEISEAAEIFPIFTLQQARLVANFCWGQRPQQKQTSVFLAVLQNENFSPYTSPQYFRQLLVFQQAFKKLHYQKPLTATT